jgi:hypothetical protein
MPSASKLLGDCDPGGQNGPGGQTTPPGRLDRPGWSHLGMDSDVWKSELSVFVSAKNVIMDIYIRIPF